MKLSSYLNAINFSKEKMSEIDEDYDMVKKKYVPFVVNRCLSFSPDCLIQSNNINRMGFLDKDIQFEYLRLSIRKKKRFSKWGKKEEDPKIQVIMKYFGYNYKKAYDVSDLISEEEVKMMEEEMVGM